MPKPRANAISRLLTNGGFTRSTPESPGFTVYQVGDDLVHIHTPAIYDLTGICDRLRLCEYHATIDSVNGGNHYVRVVEVAQ